MANRVERRPHHGRPDRRVVDAASSFILPLEKGLVKSGTSCDARIEKILVLVFEIHVAIECDRSQPGEVFDFVRGIKAGGYGRQGRRESKTQDDGFAAEE